MFKAFTKYSLLNQTVVVTTIIYGITDSLFLSAQAKAPNLANTSQRSAEDVISQSNILQTQNLNLSQINSQNNIKSNYNQPIWPNIEVNNTEENTIEDTMGQVTSVSQLTDVRPTDWAFQALQNLVERYGCIAGYPDRTFRGNRTITRYEFAAGLNACLEKINQLISQKNNNITTADLEKLRKLQEEFAKELATFKSKVDSLESRTTVLEENRFAPITKLKGEVNFALRNSFGGDNVFNSFTNDKILANSSAVLQYTARLDFLTSFTGQDQLTVRLGAGNVGSLFSSQKLNFIPISSGLEDDETDDVDDFEEYLIELGPTKGPRIASNDIRLRQLSYRLPFAGKKGRINIFASGGSHALYADKITQNRTNPIYKITSASAGLGVNYKFNKYFKFDAGYLSQNANNPTDFNGLFSGQYSTLAQLVFEPSKKLRFGLTYIHTYAPDSTRFRFGDVGNILNNLDNITTPNSLSSNSYGIAGSWRLSSRFTMGAWGSLTQVNFHENEAKGDIWNYGVVFSFPNLGKEGNLGVIEVGVDPTLRGFRVGNSYRSLVTRDEILYVDAGYKYVITDNIAIEPRLVWLPALFQDRYNDDVFIGTIKTTFKF